MIVRKTLNDLSWLAQLTLIMLLTHLDLLTICSAQKPIHIIGKVYFKLLSRRHDCESLRKLFIVDLL